MVDICNEVFVGRDKDVAGWCLDLEQPVLRLVVNPSDRTDCLPVGIFDGEADEVVELHLLCITFFDEFVFEVHFAADELLRLVG